ncbi:MAG: GxxExxY protein [Agriterribacter sp.]
MPEYKYGDITEKIIGACLRIHNTLGNGFPEVIYQRALALELRALRLSFEREFNMDVYYMSQKVGSRRVDFFVENKISVELKAMLKLEDGHLAQAMNCLEAYNLENRYVDKCWKCEIAISSVYQQKV